MKKRQALALLLAAALSPIALAADPQIKKAAQATFTRQLA